MEGIWKYSKHFNTKIQEEYRVSLGEGNTAIYRSDKLSEIYNCNIYLKREDENPTGSHKDRNNALQISYYYQQGLEELTLSSSGNNAISAIRYIKKTPIKLTIFLPDKLSLSKKKRIDSALEHSNPEQIRLVYSKKALSDSIKYAKEKDIPNLRPSLDSLALEGQSTLGIELAKNETLNKIQLDGIFVPLSSGTGFMGIANGYKLLNKTLPPLFAVQTSKVNPISSEFDENFIKESHSLAKAIVAKTSPRKNEIIETIKESNGGAWTIENKDIKNALEIIDEAGENRNNDLSYDAALSLAGLIKAQHTGRIFKNVVLVFTGK